MSCTITTTELDAVRKQSAEAMSALSRTHMQVLDAMRGALPADAIVVTDMTQIAYSGNTYYACATPRSWFHPNGYGTLGYALPAAIGARLGAPHRAVVALAGDGGLLFTIQELATAAELRLPLVIVLWNNDGLGQIRDDMIAKGIATHQGFLYHMMTLDLRYKVPLGLLGRFHVEKEGDNAGLLSVKYGGCVYIVDCVRMFALERGIQAI